MAFQSIGTNEVDANSPLSSTLMSKIRNDLCWLFESCIPNLFLDDFDHAEPETSNITVSPKDQWVTVRDFGLISLRPSAKTIKMSVRMSPSPCVGDPRHVQAVKFQLYDLNSGNVLNESEAFYFSSSGWQGVELSISDPSSGFVGCRLQCYQENGGCLLEDEWFYHRCYGWVDALK